MESKRCTKCSEEKPLDEFYASVHKTDGKIQLSSECKACIRTRQKAIADQNRQDPEWRERQAAYQKAYREAHKERAAQLHRERYERQPPEWHERERVRKRLYAAKKRAELKADPELQAAARVKWKQYRRLKLWGLSPDEVDALILQQKGRCALCRRPFADGPKDINVDHNHQTGHLRGLLCNPCNLGLGLFRDDPATFRAAIAYLRRGAIMQDLELVIS